MAQAMQEFDTIKSFPITVHAQKRLSQRGISGHLLALVLAHADVETELGGGCVGLRVSKRLANRLDMRLKLGSNIERVTNIVVVWSEINSSIVTVLHPHDNCNNKNYLRRH
jgi:hypothetical protein